jgi:hypothetical protein
MPVYTAASVRFLYNHHRVFTIVSSCIAGKDEMKEITIVQTEHRSVPLFHLTICDLRRTKDGSCFTLFPNLFIIFIYFQVFNQV